MQRMCKIGKMFGRFMILIIVDGVSYTISTKLKRELIAVLNEIEESVANKGFYNFDKPNGFIVERRVCHK
jgi:hypothetical protein